MRSLSGSGDYFAPFYGPDINSPLGMMRIGARNDAENVSFTAVTRGPSARDDVDS
jgi:hypothetical protein